jgi:PAS domain S-box-containing protein
LFTRDQINEDLNKETPQLHQQIQVFREKSATGDSMNRHENKKLQYIIEGSNLATWEWNVQTGETIFNQRWAEIIGYTLEEIQPVDINTWIGFCHPDDLKKSDEALQLHFTSQTPFYDFESRMKHKNGSWVWVHDRGKVIEWTNDGKPLFMFGTHTDITSRKQTEASLAASEQRLNMVLECTASGWWDNDLVTGQLTLSPMWKKILGYEADELDNTFDTWRNRWHPDDIAKIKQVTEDYRLGKTDQYEITYRMKHKNGAWIWILTRGGILKDLTGKPYRWIGTNTDVTSLIIERMKNAERIMAEEQVKKSREDLLKFASQVPGMLFQYEITPEGKERVPFSTDAIKELLGCTPEEVRDDFTPIRKVIHPSDVERMNAAIAESIKSNSPFNLEYRVLLPGQPVRWILARSMPEKKMTARSFFTVSMQISLNASKPKIF